jgi:predicted PurR-regulated permease PerM
MADTPGDKPHDLPVDPEYRRDRLLSALVILFGVALALALPFALRSGAVFFMPVTVAFVVALMLVPLLEWLERRRVPSGIAALIALVLFLFIANATLVMIVIPASEWVRMLPEHAAQVRANISPLVDAFNALEKLGNQLATAVGQQAATARERMPVQQPTSIIALVATSAPAVLIEIFLAILLVYFFLAGWTAMRAKAIRERETLTGSLRVARMLRDMVSGTAQYLLTITIINASLGAVVAALVWALGMPTPLMWGGLAAIFNFVPYVGPIVVTGLLALGGLIVFNDVFPALLPAAAFLMCHLIEANVVTPRVVGHRLTVSPVWILLALSFWGWVWGAVGALVSVPLLILMKVMLDRVGRPDVLGFLFDGRTLSRHTDA